MATHRKKLIDIFIKDLSPGSFTDYLGISSQKFAPVATSTGSITFTFNVPSHLCLQGRSSPYLSTSATMALFDEYSSMCLMMKDRCARGGVSIVLTADLHNECPPNSEVTIVTTATKVGKTIGFCDIEMFDKNSNLLASGSHVKYIDMGKAWDVVMHPSRIKHTLAFYESMGSKLQGTALGDKISAILGKGGSRMSTPLTPPFDKAGKAFRDFNIEMPSSDQSNAQVHVKPHMCNYFGNLHGGAAAMIAEACATQLKVSATYSSYCTACLPL